GDGRAAARQPRAAARAARGPWRPLTGPAGSASRRAGRRSGRADEETQMIIMAYRQYRQYRRWRIIADQRLGGLLAPHKPPENSLGHAHTRSLSSRRPAHDNHTP